MKQNKLHNIKSTGFKTPKNYFDGLDGLILNQAKLEDKVLDTGFKTPKGYFDTLEDNLLNKVKPEPKVISLFSRKNIMYAASIAAIFVLMIATYLNYTSTESQLEVAEIEQYLLEQDIADYEFATLLSDNDLQTNIFTEITTESLEDYLSQNTTLDDLIIE